MNQRRKNFYTVSGIIILVLVVVAVWATQLAQAPAGGMMATSSPSPMAGATGTPKASYRPAPAPGASAMPVSYDNAVKQYGGHRIQFDMYCQANPSSLSLANGTVVMLDNRSGDARTVRVGGVAYVLSGYGWKIITVSSKVLPATIGLDCGSGRNVGTIIVQ